MMTMSTFGQPMTAEALYGAQPSAQASSATSSTPGLAAPAHAGSPEPNSVRPDTPQQSNAKKSPLGLLHQPTAVIVGLVGIGLLLVWLVDHT